MIAEENKVINIPEELKPLIPGYLARRDLDLKNMKDFHQQGNFDEIRKIGHKLKGNGLGYGFDYLSVLGKKIEVASELKSGEEIGSYLLELEEYLSYVKTQVLEIAS